MNIKASVAVAVLAASTFGVSACASQASKASAAGAARAVATAPTTATSSATETTSLPETAPSTSSQSSQANGSNPATPTAPQLRPPVRTDIPGGAMLLQGDLAPSWSGNWRQLGGPPTPGSQAVDPDNCDPVTRPQFMDPNYPRNPAWVVMQSLAWAGSDYSEVGEQVVTYTTATAASADFAKHHGWVADCGTHFQWTDKPAKYTISNVPLNGVGVVGSYAFRVAMDPPDQPALTGGSQGVVFTAVILRGNSLAFVTVSEADPAAAAAQGVVLGAFQHDVQVAATKLGTVYAPTR